MDTKKVVASLIGIVAVLSIVFTLNYSLGNATITGNVVEGQACSTPNQDTCTGENVYLCINGEWRKIGLVPGKCGYQTGSSGGGNECIDDFDCLDSESCRNGNCVADSGGIPTGWIIVLAIVIAILIVLGIIIYFIVKKDNKFRNNKAFDKKTINGKPMPPMSKPHNLPHGNMTRPMNQPPIKPISSPSNSNQVKRYTPPKR